MKTNYRTRTNVFFLTIRKATQNRFKGVDVLQTHNEESKATRKRFLQRKDFLALLQKTTAKKQKQRRKSEGK